MLLRGAMLPAHLPPCVTYSFDFTQPHDALRLKGFKVLRYTHDNLPTPTELEELLRAANQLWVISSCEQVLNSSHRTVIERAWRGGLGVAIYGDNEPYYVDANLLLQTMLPASGLEMKGWVEVV